MGGIIDERQGAKSPESQRRQKIANSEKGRQKGEGEEAGEEAGGEVGKKEIDAPQGGAVRRIYSRCSPFCPLNHHLCALRCSAFVVQQMFARLLHLAASRIEPVCAVLFNFSLSREYKREYARNND